jgi:hypothetical protein
MLNRLATRVGKRMMRLRAATIEPVLGSLITYYGRFFPSSSFCVGLPFYCRAQAQASLAANPLFR